MAKRWKKIVGALAPTLGNALLGPLGGVAMSALAESLGLDPGASEREVAAKVNSLTSADVAKMHEADVAFKETLSDNEVEEFRISTADRKDARAMRMALNDTTPRNLAYLITIGFIGFVGVLVFYGDHIDDGVHDVLMALVGLLGGILGTVYAFFFGSSKGSADKTSVIHDMHKNGKIQDH